MAQSGSTPIQLYSSTTASAAPSAVNLANGELAINITDGKLYYKDNAGAVQTIAVKLPLPVANGGTGSTTAAAAKIALAVVTAATGSQVVPSGTTGQRDGSPVAGYFRYNTTTSSFEGYTSAWGSVGGGATGAGGDTVFQENSLIVTTSYTLTTGKSAMSVGPITSNGGVVVTIPSSYRWVIF